MCAVCFLWTEVVCFFVGGGGVMAKLKGPWGWARRGCIGVGGGETGRGSCPDAVAMKQKGDQEWRSAARKA